MNLSDANLRLALLKTLVGLLSDSLATERAEHLDLLVGRYGEEGTKSFDVRLPPDEGGQRVKVATVSLTVPKDSIDVTDPDALTDWAKDNAPTLLRTEVIPASEGFWVAPTPEHREVTVDPKRLTEFLSGVRPGPAGSVVDVDTGQLVDGLTHTPGGQPRSFSVRPTPDGGDDLVRAWRAGLLEHVLTDTPLPQIGVTA